MREMEMLRERQLDPASMMGIAAAPPEPAEDDKPGKGEDKPKKDKAARHYAVLH
jgi:hypothetical protein